MVVHKLVMGSADLYRSRLYCRSFVDSCNFTNKANSHAPKVEISTGEKLCHFGRYVGKAKLICLKSFVPSYSDWSVHMGKFPSRLPRSRSQKPRYRKPGQHGLLYEHINIFTKKWVARRYLGDQASPRG